MQILSGYTWQQKAKFFAIGAATACAYGVIPAFVAAWHNYRNYSDATDWGLVWELLATGVGLRLRTYWNEHKALLEVPPSLSIPKEFQPSQQKPHP